MDKGRSLGTVSIPSLVCVAGTMYCRLGTHIQTLIRIVCAYLPLTVSLLCTAAVGTFALPVSCHHQDAVDAGCVKSPLAQNVHLLV